MIIGVVLLPLSIASLDFMFWLLDSSLGDARLLMPVFSG